jgi:hypothetical protein
MRPIRATRHSRNPTWRVRAVQLALALAGTGLMTAIAAAAIGANQGPSVDRAMAAAIVAQQIADGQGAKLEPGTPPGEAATRAQILAEADKLEADMKTSVGHADTLRIEAYHQKDMIRVSFITAKLNDMKQILAIAMPALAILRQPGQDLFVMRAKLNTIRQGAERIKDAMAAAEASEGDSTDPTSSAFAPVNAETNPSQNETDPTAPPAPTDEFERPSQASPYQ